MRFVAASALALLATTALPPILHERTEPSGIIHKLENDATDQKHLIETMAGGVAAFDFDNDGNIDLFFTNGAAQPALAKSDAKYSNRLYRNLGHWTFEDVTKKAGLAGSGYDVGVAAGDFDNDGFVDLYVAGVQRNTLYRNRGDGTFEDVTAKSLTANKGMWSVAAGWFDYDNDGRLDLFVVNYVKWNPATEPFCGERGKYRTYCHPKFYDALPNTLYHNNGDGTFTDVSVASGIARHVGKGMSLAFADYDDDGRTDVVITNDTVPNFLFHNEGNGTFREVGMEAGIAINDDGRAVSAMGVDFRDTRNAGRPDLLITALINESFPFYRNLDKKLFSDATYSSRIGSATLLFSGWGVGIYDFNNDGRKDVFAACGDVQTNAEVYSSRKSKQSSLLLLQGADGRFESLPVGTPALGRGAAFADLDNDGRVDVIVTALGDSPRLIQNTGAVAHWLDIELQGRSSNRDGLGTVVHISTRDGEQWNHATTAVGYASSSDKRVHFGLGQQTVVDRVEIRWPSGTRQILNNVRSDQRLSVTEAK